MSNRNDPGGGPHPTEFLFSSPGAEPGATEDPHRGAEILAELRAIAERVGSLEEELRQLRSAAEGAESGAPVGEFRSRLDELSQETRQANERLLGRIAEVEAAVRASDSERSVEDIAHRLTVAETSLVGLSDTVRGVETRLFERLEPVERAATSVEETTGALEITAGKLAAAAEANARVLPAVEELRKAVTKLEIVSGLCLGLVLAWLVLLSFALEKRIRLFGDVFGLW